MESRHTGSHHQRSGKHGEGTGRSRQAANLLEGTCSLVLRQETNDRGVKAEAGEIAEQDDQNPDKHENPVFIFAHEAREDDLGNEGEGGAHYADRKGGKCHPLCGCLVAVPGQNCGKHAQQTASRWTQARRQQSFRCFNDRHYEHATL